MEPVITPLLLASTGVDIPDDQVAALLDYMNEVLEERVGEAVVESLTDNELEELADVQENATDEEVQQWIETHVTDLAEIIQDEVDILLGETAEHQADFSAQE